MGEIDVTVGGTDDKLYVKPARVHVQEIQNHNRNDIVHIVHITLEDDLHGLIVKQLLLAAKHSKLNPFPQTCPVDKAKALCADYLVKTVARHPTTTCPANY